MIGSRQADDLVPIRYVDVIDGCRNDTGKSRAHRFTELDASTSLTELDPRGDSRGRSVAISPFPWSAPNAMR